MAIQAFDEGMNGVQHSNYGVLLDSWVDSLNRPTSVFHEKQRQFIAAYWCATGHLLVHLFVSVRLIEHYCPGTVHIYEPYQ